MEAETESGRRAPDPGDCSRGTENVMSAFANGFGTGGYVHRGGVSPGRVRDGAEGGGHPAPGE